MRVESRQMTTPRTLPETPEQPAPLADLVRDYLAENPDLELALRTFEMAQDEYGKSLAALDSTKVLTSHSTNVA